MNEARQDKDYPLNLDCPHCAIHEFCVMWIEHKAERDNDGSGGQIVSALIANVMEQINSIENDAHRHTAAFQTLATFVEGINQIVQKKPEAAPDLPSGNAPSSKQEH
jgi:hypothetical protein